MSTTTNRLTVSTCDGERYYVLDVPDLLDDGCAAFISVKNCDDDERHAPRVFPTVAGALRWLADCVEADGGAVWWRQTDTGEVPVTDQAVTR